MKTVMITGGAGFIGSNLAHYLSRNLPNTDIVIVDDFSGGYVENIPTDGVITTYEEDVCSEMLSNIFRDHKPTVVYHLAAYAAECLSPFIRKFNYQNNLIGTANVVNNCIEHGVEKIVFGSSIAVYGRQGDYNDFKPIQEKYLTLDEFDEPDPQDPYGVAKLACELDIEIAHKQHGLNYTIFRMHNVFGPRQNMWDKYRNAIGIWMRQVRNGEPITIFGDGSQVREFTFVDDIMYYLYKAGMDRSNSGLYNLGTSQPVKIIDAATWVYKAMMDAEPSLQPVEIVHLPSRHEAMSPTCNHDLISKTYGNVSITDLSSALAKTATWYLDQKDREPQNMSEYYEITEGMPEVWK
jgi:UDP-glucose 4-epimerase